MNAIIHNVFTGHPASVGETYPEHLRFASRTGVVLLGAGLAAIAHGLVPCLFKSTSSSTVLRLAEGMRRRFPNHRVLAESPSEPA